MAQTPRTPDVKAQRIAMNKLAFRVGEWSGEANSPKVGIGSLAGYTRRIQDGRCVAHQ